jgi:hypothetical protein
MTQPTDKSLLREWLAKTAGVQTREKALASIEARRARFPARNRPDTRRDDEIPALEPVPLIEEPDDYAADFWKRQAAKNEAKKRPPLGKKPRLIVDNSDPPLPPKKR